MKAWERSRKTCTYVGEWHTHPFGDPHPSLLDRSTWRSVANRIKAPCVFVIVSPAGWKVFRVTSFLKPAKSAKLTPIENGEKGMVFG